MFLEHKNEIKEQNKKKFEIIMPNFGKLMTEMKPWIQEAQGTPIRINNKKFSIYQHTSEYWSQREDL